jgi:ribosomal protein RSM22 (predicted rRNA methylase)
MQSHLPFWLGQALEAELQGISGKALATEYSRLSEAYQQGKPSQATADPALFWLAYAAGRMPATYAAVQAVFRQIPPGQIQSCQSLCDWGSGPGTAIWAALDFLPGLTAAHGLEHQAQALALAEKFAQSAPLKPSFGRLALPASAASAPDADLVILAYALGEMGAPVLDQAWSKTRKLLLVVEPGTPAGFKAILQARKKIPGLIAPCPQAGDCPLAASPQSKWCHFSARLERGKMARLIKGGELGYEDEKFSYAVFAKEPQPWEPGSRILGKPKLTGKTVRLELCGKSGISIENVVKSDRPRFKLARKAQWGEPWRNAQDN